MVQYSRSETRITEASFSALKQKVKKSTDETSGNILSLVMDEMAIRQHVEWDGKKYHGFIDVGTELDDPLPVAKEALTFMEVS
ncbi:putative DNA transposase THAP9-like 2 [Homarus americanus]|uniref:Putative DNA transposase THAP9-like 2 n=1 Tax=Homarus americanus TaxID=6706 RepID=A0A8J5MTJ2_HOMAM|nr:putative DNA transposase THAP9-like 2 [Homarus americanus]